MGGGRGARPRNWGRGAPRRSIGRGEAAGDFRRDSAVRSPATAGRSKRALPGAAPSAGEPAPSEARGETARGHRAGRRGEGAPSIHIKGRRLASRRSTVAIASETGEVRDGEGRVAVPPTRAGAGGYTDFRPRAQRERMRGPCNDESARRRREP